MANGDDTLDTSSQPTTSFALPQPSVDLQPQFWNALTAPMGVPAPTTPAVVPPSATIEPTATPTGSSLITTGKHAQGTATPEAYAAVGQWTPDQLAGRAPPPGVTWGTTPGYVPPGSSQLPTQPPTTNQLTAPSPQVQAQPQPTTGQMTSRLQLMPPTQTGALQYQPQQQPPAGRQPTEVGQQRTDPDTSRYVSGTNIPIAVAKQFIRGYEPGAAGYRAAWGVKGGLPANVETDETGFPTQQAYPGAPIGGAYGGAYGSGTMSHAAGMYQIEPQTWKTAVAGLAKEGVQINDFSPQSQEQVASWLLEHQGMSPWAGVGPSGVPFNANLKAAWEQYQASGKMPQLSSPSDYAGFYGRGGPIYAGDTSGGYGVGGALAFAPQGPAMPGGAGGGGGSGGAAGGGGQAQNAEANPNAAGGPGGAPQLTAAERAFMQMTRQQQQGRGYQMLALLAAMMKGHQVTSGYNPENAMPKLTLHETPLGGTAGYSPVGSVQTPGVMRLQRNYGT